MFLKKQNKKNSGGYQVNGSSQLCISVSVTVCMTVFVCLSVSIQVYRNLCACVWRPKEPLESSSGASSTSFKQVISLSYSSPSRLASYLGILLSLLTQKEDCRYITICPTSSFPFLISSSIVDTSQVLKYQCLI